MYSKSYICVSNRSVLHWVHLTFFRKGLWTLPSLSGYVDIVSQSQNNSICHIPCSTVCVCVCVRRCFLLDCWSSLLCLTVAWHLRKHEPHVVLVEPEPHWRTWAAERADCAQGPTHCGDSYRRQRGMAISEESCVTTSLDKQSSSILDPIYLFYLFACMVLWSINC